MLFTAKFINKFKTGSYTSKRLKSFTDRMAEALEKLKADKALQKDKQEAESQIVKETKRMKREMKRRKWVDWKTEDELDPERAAKRAAFDPADRIKRKKSAILLAYCGAEYYGMQRNPGMPTIEEELFKAMLKHKWIAEEAFEQAQAAQFQRAARTDKGVSAARQVCSLKLPDDVDIEALNKDLPEKIRVFGVQRVTKGFNSKDQCNARSYTYTLPSIALAKYEENKPLPDYETFRIDEGQLKKFGDVLKLYEGTKNFHNFTSRKNFLDPSAKRFIMSFTHSAPFVAPQGIEFITAKVKGQSFMLHQIRKMIGVAMAITRGNTTEATLDLAFSETRVDLPMAPGLGLVLDTVHYERYDERYGKDGIHEPLTWEKQDAQIKEFIEKYINANIYETEFKERPTLAWIETLAFHSYEARTEEAGNKDEQGEENGNETTNKKKGADDDDNEE